MEYIDMHSHILPGLDDGSKNMEMTLGMVISLFAYGLLCLINKSKERISYRVIFYALFIVACAYLFFIANPDFKNLMMNAGIYNRFLLVDAMSQYYKFSLTHSCRSLERTFSWRQPLMSIIV